MENVLTILLYVDAIIMMLAILLQARGVGLSAALGGQGGVFRKKRGPEKFLHILTIVTAIIFVLLAFFIPFSDRLF